MFWNSRDSTNGNRSTHRQESSSRSHPLNNDLKSGMADPKPSLLLVVDEAYSETDGPAYI